MSEFGSKLAAETIGCRLEQSKFGATKAMSRDQTRQTAEVFDAVPTEVTGRKRLIARREKAWQKVTAILTTAKNYWKAMTVPYPDDGVRLIRRDTVEEFNAEMTKLNSKLGQAVSELDEAIGAIKSERQVALGELYNDADYPTSFDGAFAIAWSFPSLEPSEHLKKLSPAIYQAECERVAAQFSQAVSLAESAFADELKKLLESVANKIDTKSDTKKPKLDDKVFVKLVEFVNRFRMLSVGSNESLESLVQQAEQLVKGSVGSSGMMNLQTVSEKFGELSKVVDQAVVIRPRRKILLDSSNETTDADAA